ITGLTNASGAPNITIDGGGTQRIFDVEGGASGVSITLQNLVVSGGAASSGAGVYINDTAGGTVTLTNLNVRNNKATGADGAAGAIGRQNHTGGAAQSALGGGIYYAGGTSGQLILTSSTLQNNLATGGKGGIGGVAGPIGSGVTYGSNGAGGAG